MYSAILENTTQTIDLENMGWTVVDVVLASPECRRVKLVVPGMDGELDLSKALTGQMQYANRQLTLYLDCCASTRAYRETLIANLINTLSGNEFNIFLEDDPLHYFIGSVGVKAENGDAACTAAVICDCYPWRYKTAETMVSRTDLTTSYKNLTLNNECRPVVPKITVTAETTLKWGDNTYTLAAGENQLVPQIVLAAGENTLKAKLTADGTGSISVTYQEASL